MVSIVEKEFSDNLQSILSRDVRGTNVTLTSLVIDIVSVIRFFVFLSSLKPQLLSIRLLNASLQSIRERKIYKSNKKKRTDQLFHLVNSCFPRDGIYFYIRNSRSRNFFEQLKHGLIVKKKKKREVNRVKFLNVLCKLVYLIKKNISSQIKN